MPGNTQITNAQVGPISLLAVLVSLSFFPRTDQVVSSEIFTEITDEAAIAWKHFNGESEDRLLIEASCGGVAFVDFDNDGLLDIYLVNGGETPKGKSPRPVRNALYRNLNGKKF